MNLSLSHGEILDFFGSPVWGEMLIRILKEIDNCDAMLERPDPFEHGRAVGMRQAYRTMLAYEKALPAEAQGRSPYGGKRNP